MSGIIEEKRYIAKTLNVEFDELSQGYIRAETLLTTQTDIRFNLQKGKGVVPIVTERLLELTDKFVATEFRINLKSIPATATDLEHALGMPIMYNDAQIFTTGNNVNVGAMYNGNFRWVINRKEFLPNFPMLSFLRIPRTQTMANVDYTASGSNTQNSYTNGLFGFYPCEPIILNGAQTIDSVINLNTSVAIADASAAVFAVFEIRGYLIVNALQGA